MVVTLEQMSLLTEAMNAGFTEKECLEYAGIAGYYAVDIGGNDAGNPNIGVEFWEPVDSFTEKDEAIKEAKRVAKAGFPVCVRRLNHSTVWITANRQPQPDTCKESKMGNKIYNELFDISCGSK